MAARRSLGNGAGQGKAVGARGEPSYDPVDLAEEGRMALRRSGFAAAVLVSLAGLPPAALATSSVHCRGMQGSRANLSLTLAPLPAPVVLFVRIEVDGRRWSTAPGEEAEPLAIAQSFTTPEGIAVDLVDDQAMRRVASLRVLRVEEGRRLHQYGYLQLHGLAVHPVVCEGP